jgi:hypothetical protein
MQQQEKNDASTPFFTGFIIAIVTLAQCQAIAI